MSHCEHAQKCQQNCGGRASSISINHAVERVSNTRVLPIAFAQRLSVEYYKMAPLHSRDALKLCQLLESFKLPFLS